MEVTGAGPVSAMWLPCLVLSALPFISIGTWAEWPFPSSLSGRAGSGVTLNPRMDARAHPKELTEGQQEAPRDELHGE